MQWLHKGSLGSTISQEATASMAVNPSLRSPTASSMDGNDTITAEVCKEADVGDGE